MYEGIVEEEIESQNIIFGWVVMKAATRRIADPYLGARTDQTVFGVGVKKRDLLRKPARMGKIIMVLPCDIAAPRKRDAAVECSRKALVFLVINPHPGIGNLVEELPGTVSRAIVNSNQFKIRERLSQDGIERRRQILSAVADRQDHADGRGIAPANHGLQCQGYPKSRAQAPE